MVEADEITLTLPRDREFHRVAHNVLGGVAIRLELTIETLEDLQLALGALLDRAEVGSSPGDDITVTLTLRDGTVEALVGPIELGDELTRDDEGLGLRRVLATVVDDVQLDGDYVRLTKKVEPVG
jgi:hypothetical protein